MSAFRFGAVLLAVFLVRSTPGSAVQGTNGLPLITSVRELRTLAPTEAAKEYPVKLRGVITFNDWTRAATFLHDGQDSTFIWISGADWIKQAGERVNLLNAGALVEVEGVSAPGDFMVCVSGPGWTSARLRILGQGQLPEPIQMRPEEFMEPEQDQRWVQVEGIIRQVTFEDGYSVLELDVGRYQVKGVVAGRGTAGPLPWQLVQVPVKLRGVVGSIFNKERQMTGRILCIPSEADIVPLAKADTPGREEAPLRTPATLLQVGSPKTMQPTRVQGIVTWHQQGRGLYLRGSDGSLWVQTAQLLELQPGAKVEVLGLPVPAPFRPFLQAMNVRLLGTEPAPRPRSLEVAELFTGRQQGELVSVAAEFLESSRGAEHELMVQLREGGRLFQARLSPHELRASELAPGSRLRVTGICEMQAARRLWTPEVADRVEIQLRSLADIELIAHPRWWTVQRLLPVLGGLLAALALAALWVMALRRRVATQTRIIHQKVEREAIWEERSRIAQDLHDDVGASLTQISLLGEIVRRGGTSSGPIHDQLSKISLKAKEAVRALDEIVWTVNPRNDTLPRVASYLSNVARDLLQETGIRCRYRIPESLPELTLNAKIRHELLLAVKEALRNVLKHSQATEFRLTLSVSPGELRVSVADNGCGFDPAAADPGRNGLANMERRLLQVGGRFELQSKPGEGTEVKLMVPLAGEIAELSHGTN